MSIKVFKIRSMKIKVISTSFENKHFSNSDPKYISKFSVNLVFYKIINLVL